MIGTNNPHVKAPERTQSLDQSLLDMEVRQIPEVDDEGEGDETQ